MRTITLPDGKQQQFEHNPTIYEVAANIGPGLAKAALAGELADNGLVDVSTVLSADTALRIITANDKEGLEIIRHSAAHLLAQAVKRLFPTAQVTIGPVIDNGFYYDFAFERAFTPDDLIAIEATMHEIAKQSIAVKRLELSRAEAIDFFAELGEYYKVEIIQAIPGDEVVSCYQQAEFADLCRGPHVPNTRFLQAFKLTKVAGAYWRGDSNNEMLQRIYGTAWPDKKTLDSYLQRLEEAEKRDHRRLAKQMHLFHIQEEAPGMIFWHHKGWTIYRLIQQYMSEQQQQAGYLEVHTPQVIDRSLWERSGHWEKFSDEMLTTASEKREYAIKPMNCPGHIQIFNQQLHSYRNLPLRLAEFGSCHRNEPSGTLHGLMRVRNFVQDDAHIFCSEDQIQAEVVAFIDFVFTIYNDFGFTDIIINLSTRPEKRVGSDAIWDKAEQALSTALESKAINYGVLPGEGAFYGPKIEFSLRDCLDRVWQCGTMQVDFSMPERLGAQYVAEDGSRQTPVMLHRAALGSFERFVGILLEQYAGRLPVWLAPTQVAILTITDQQNDYADAVAKRLKQQGIRALSDLRNEKVGLKIREHTLQRIPYLLVLGKLEVKQSTVAVRTVAGDDLGQMPLEKFTQQLLSDVARRIAFA